MQYFGNCWQSFKDLASPILSSIFFYFCLMYATWWLDEMCLINIYGKIQVKGMTIAGTKCWEKLYSRRLQTCSLVPRRESFIVSHCIRTVSHHTKKSKLPGKWLDVCPWDVSKEDVIDFIFLHTVRSKCKIVIVLKSIWFYIRLTKRFWLMNKIDLKNHV